MQAKRRSSESIEGTLLGKYIRALLLIPYGTRMLTPMATTWIFSMLIASMTVGAVQGASWYIILTQFAKDLWSDWINALLAASITLMIWHMNVLFVTFDLSRVGRERESDRVNRRRRIFGAISNLTSSLSAAAIARLALLLISVAITTPLLSDAAQQDARARLQLTSLQEKLRSNIDHRFSVDVELLQRSIDENNALLRKELAGVGESRRSGDGPTANQLRAIITSNEKRLAGLKNEHQSQIEELKSEMAKAELVADSGNDRPKFLGLQSQRAFAGLSVIVLCFAMILAKLMEPRLVSIYYDAQLQTAYADYVHGYFDDETYLDSRRASGQGNLMDAISFNEWYYDVYEKLALSHRELRRSERSHESRRALDELVATHNLVEASLERKIGELRALQDQVVVSDLREDVTVIRAEHADSETLRDVRMQTDLVAEVARSANAAASNMERANQTLEKCIAELAGSA
jgi:hypothetical protein